MYLGGKTAVDFREEKKAYRDENRHNESIAIFVVVVTKCVYVDRVNVYCHYLVHIS